MRIIVTGGAGFIASHIVDAYIAKGHHVAVIDNLSTGFRRNLNPRARFYKADICNQKLLEHIFEKERPEIMNHHAAIASVIASIANPNATFEANVLGTVNLLRAFGAHGKGKNRKIIFASTGGAIYGTPRKLPAPEATLPMPSSPYGLSKLLAEETIAFYARTSHFAHTILRYANVYGPRQNPKGEAGVVSIFAELMRQGNQPRIFGDGSKTRDYVYVADIARANVAALTKGNGETINLGTGIMTSDKEVFGAVAQALKFRGTPQYAPFRSGEVNKISLDARRARRVLNWKPRVSFEEGVRRTVS
ncbi:MAG: GDP-mannose 4,6-dehydratase [Candidatus Liptonbacteria bacterium]|nr:GDP-mannose 4,6-dehydratase [Candidatus Liptonbacteria bacterium]